MSSEESQTILGSSTLNELLLGWLSFKKNRIKIQSYEKYEQLIKLHLSESIGRLPVSDLNTKD